MITIVMIMMMIPIFFYINVQLIINDNNGFEVIIIAGKCKLA
jgi:hypothetical protein